MEFIASGGEYDQLARWIQPIMAAARENPEAKGCVLGGHGLFTWADDAKGCYELTLDIINRAMIEVHRWLLGVAHARLMMQVHDELILEVAEEKSDSVLAELRGHMANAASLRVPLKVEVGVGKDWDQAH